MSRSTPAPKWHKEIQAIDAAILATLSFRVDPLFAKVDGHDFLANAVARGATKSSSPAATRAAFSPASQPIATDST